ncbi:5-deoxy-glucuronate isomerase [Austwickia sp. TVS 96-490-7B]|uniref:5-deoxy-glucuronate isomerase n=1 Tax=Austwickia sp. TVS 96-490-7B TaxID=2830843 RepID=UPI001C5A4C7C|nr:5-deoxy-glucuronate isomerase [Austwickia sp. TVS 96-490-7B]MBW3085244.1 5-deoxy-glucuronate isomerase [Austwickia sp. TVS 96-490-7B]
MSDWFRRAGSAAHDGYDLQINPGDPGWFHTGLWTATLRAGQSRHIDCGDAEWIVLPLSGSFRVDAEVHGQQCHADLAGRSDVFAGPTDSAFIPRDATFTVTAVTDGRIALPFAKARTAYPFAYVAAADVPVELRGAGQASRQVQNFGTPGTVDADSIIACEVITPAGNWSSYPPHKHDVDIDGVESALEEIYYYEMRTEPGVAVPAGVTPDPMGYQRVYGTDDRPLDVLEEVRTGDAVLIPHGWHGPAMAPTGYDMYYLNVMAGPGEQRVWLICDDPSHAWVRDTWPSQQIDVRLPLHQH